MVWCGGHSCLKDVDIDHKVLFIWRALGLLFNLQLEVL